MNRLLDTLQVVGTAATAFAVLLVWLQVRLQKRQAITAFEDSLAKEYRDVVQQIPVGALLGRTLGEEEQGSHLGSFYRYIDLTNQQVFLRKTGRISAETWCYWQDGIKDVLTLPAFADAWRTLKAQAPKTFQELRRLEDEGFKKDPSRW